jgi:hypothetical protein
VKATIAINVRAALMATDTSLDAYMGQDFSPVLLHDMGPVKCREGSRVTRCA